VIFDIGLIVKRVYKMERFDILINDKYWKSVNGNDINSALSNNGINADILHFGNDSGLLCFDDDDLMRAASDCEISEDNNFIIKFKKTENR